MFSTKIYAFSNRFMFFSLLAPPVYTARRSEKTIQTRRGPEPPPVVLLFSGLLVASFIYFPRNPTCLKINGVFLFQKIVKCISYSLVVLGFSQFFLGCSELFPQFLCFVLAFPWLFLVVHWFSVVFLGGSLVVLSFSLVCPWCFQYVLICSYVFPISVL